jgi:hypothetical protein
MSDGATDSANTETAEPISMQEFLQSVPPNEERYISGCIRTGLKPNGIQHPGSNPVLRGSDL